MEHDKKDAGVPGGTSGQIAVIGDKDSIFGFKTLGIATFPVETPEQAGLTLHRLAREHYLVIFVTERFAQHMDEAIERYKTQAFPAVVIIPDNQGSLNIGLEHVRRAAEKATGRDILFSERG